MVNRITCRESSQLTGLLDPANDSSTPFGLLDHLAACPQCQDVLEQMAVGSIDWLREGAVLGCTFHRSLSLQQTMHTLKSLTTLDEVENLSEADWDLDFLAPTDYPNSLGAIGPYPVLDLVGRGGMGIVFKAVDGPLNRIVAVKVLAPALAANGTARQRFLREARAAAAIAHEHIIGIHAVAEANLLPYLVMEYVAGVSLQQKIDRDGPLDPKDVARIALQTAEGLAAAHRQGVIHRDVKPANILLENGVGRVKLTDFGLARAVDDASATQPGTVVGTPEYMAPEQASGMLVDARADLFGLGGVIYAACTGRPPFRAASSLAVMHLVTTTDPQPIRALNPDIPDSLEAIAMKLLAKKPDGRFPSADAVAKELRQELVKMQLPDLTPAEKGIQPPRRRRPLSWLVGAGLLALIAAIIVLKFRSPDGTLVLEIDDPDGTVTVEQQDGGSIVVKGVGVKEIRLAPGAYKAIAAKGATKISDEVVNIERNGRTILKARFVEAASATTKSDRPSGPSSTIFPSREVLAFEGHTGSVRGLAITADGKRLVSCTGWPEGDGTILIWDGATGKVLRRILLKGLRTAAILVSQDGKTIFVACADGSVRAYELATGKKVYQSAASESEITSLSLSPDGELVACGGQDGKVRVLQASTGKSLRVIDAHKKPCRAVAFSPDGKFLASGGIDAAIHLWDADSGKLTKTIPITQGKGGVWALAFADDGRKLVSAGAWALVWDVKTGELLTEFQQHQQPLTSVVVSPDGSKAATGSYDGTVRVWDLATGKELDRRYAGVGFVWAVIFTPDGKNILSGGGGLFRDGEYLPGEKFTIREWALALTKTKSDEPKQPKP